jgi:two-component system sensor histidine kinase DctS
MGSMVDVTEQKRAQELARQQQERLQATARLVTMGEMASTLAHELNQPLAAISSYNTGCLNMIGNGTCPPTSSPACSRRSASRPSAPARSSGGCMPSCGAANQVRTVDLNAILREAVGLVEPDAERRSVGIDRIWPTPCRRSPPTR